MIVISGLIVAVAVAVLCGLGVWQVKRLAWKTELLARVEALKYAPAEPLNVALNHLQTGRDVDFIRVVGRCEPSPPQTPARIYAVTETGPAWRPVVLCRLRDGPYPAVLLDLGLEADAARAADAALSPPAAITGVIRTAPKHEPFMALKPGNAGEYGWRDAAGMARFLGAPGAPGIFVMLEQPAAAPGVVPAATPKDIPNNHLGYAITWFGLAAALIGVFVAAVIRRRRTG